MTKSEAVKAMTNADLSKKKQANIIMKNIINYSNAK